MMCTVYANMQARNANAMTKASSNRRHIHVAPRLKKDHIGNVSVELDVWKEMRFQDVVNFAAKMHLTHEVPLREAVHILVDTMLDFEFGVVERKEETDM